MAGAGRWASTLILPHGRPSHQVTWEHLGPLGILGGKSQTSLKRGANGTFSIIWCFLALLPQRAADRRAEVQERKTPWKRAGHRKCPQGLPAQDTGPPPASCVLTLGPPCLPGRGGLAQPLMSPGLAPVNSTSFQPHQPRLELRRLCQIWGAPGRGGGKRG